MTEIGTEKRLDELSKCVDHGFGQVDRRFEGTDQRFDRVEGDIRELRSDLRSEAKGLRSEIACLRADTSAGFERLEAKFDAKFDSLNRAVIRLLGGALAVIAGSVVAAVIHTAF